MNEELEEKETLQIESLMKLFEEREQVYAVGTSKIVEKLGPTVLAAIYQFFNVSYEAIQWIAFDVLDGVLLIGMIVTYKNTDKVPFAIERLSPLTGSPEEGTVAEVQRVMRIGVPFHYLFKDKNEIAAFMEDHITKQSPAAPPPTVFVNKQTGEKIAPVLEDPATMPISTADFDNTKLTKDQLDKLMMYQYQSKGTKQ